MLEPTPPVQIIKLGITREKLQGQFLFQNFGVEHMVIIDMQKEIILFQFRGDLNYILHVLQIMDLVNFMYI